jgi:hypothetical protein
VRIDQLQPGDYIPPEDLELELGKLIGNVRTPLRRAEDPNAFRRALLTLRDRVHAARPDLVCRTRLDGLQVLTEAEKIGYSVSVRDCGIRKLRKAVGIGLRTKREALSPEQQAQYDNETRKSQYVHQVTRLANRKTPAQLLAESEAKQLPKARGRARSA